MICMKKFICGLLIIGLIGILTGCAVRDNKELDVTFDEMNFERGNLLISFSNKFNKGNYKTNIIVERINVQHPSVIIPDYKHAYTYKMQDENGYVYNVYDYTLDERNNDILNNIMVCKENGRYYYSAEDYLNETNNIFRLDIMTGDYVSKYGVSPEELKKMQFAVYQSVLCCDDLKKRLERLKDLNIDCTASYTMDMGKEVYKQGDRYEYIITYDSAGWHYSDLDNLTGIKYDYVVTFSV